MYTQCELRKKESVQISWVPSEYAKPLQCLDLKEEDIWSKGWTVTKVYQTVSDNTVKHLSTQYRTHRKRTDI